MLTLVRIELSKLYRRRGTYVSFACLAALVLLVAVPISCYKEKVDDSLRQELSSGMGDDWVVGGKVLAGPFVPRVMLFWPMRKLVVNILLALFAAMAGGSAIAGEYSAGTLRTILTRPPARWKVFVAKFAVMGIYAASLAVFFGLFAFAVGYALFGRGALVFADMPADMGSGPPPMGAPIIQEGAAVQMLAQAYLLMGASVIAAMSLALFLSSFTSHPLTAAGAALGILLLSTILGTLGSAPEEIEFLAFFRTIRPYLLTTHMNLYEIPLAGGLDQAGRVALTSSASWLAGYCAAFFGAGLLVFRRRDVLC